MTERNETYAKIQSIRIKNLEQQVHLMRVELQRIRDCMLPPKDLFRLTSLADKLKELNDVLKDLKNHMEKSKQNQNEYNKPTEKVSNLDDTEYPKEDFEHLPTAILDRNFVESNESLQKKEKCFLNRDNAFANDEYEITDEIKTETFKTCKELMSDIKSPGSILGNYLVKLQDFRADPELRRKRMERKRKEKEAELELKARNKSTESIVSQATSSEPNLKETLTSPPTDSAEILNDTFSGESATDSKLSLDLLLVRKNLKEIVYDVVRDHDRDNIALTVVLETDKVYHISVSTTTSGESLACFFSTEDAIQEAKLQNLFTEFLTLFVINAENSLEQKDRILGHSFEFIKLDV